MTRRHDQKNEHPSTMENDMSDTAPQQAGDSARVEQFKAEIDELKLKGGSAENEKRLLALGVVLMAAGIALAVFGAIEVGTNGGSPADQRAYMAQGSLLGITLVIVGAALFVRYSLARYLRFWLIRSTYEGRSNSDRVVDAIERASGLSEPAPTVATAPPQVVVPPAPPAPPSPAPAPGFPPG
jgi:hypothetical protein